MVYLKYKKYPANNIICRLAWPFSKNYNCWVCIVNVFIVASSYVSTQTNILSFTRCLERYFCNTRNKNGRISWTLPRIMLSKKKDSFPLLGVKIFHALPKDLQKLINQTNSRTNWSKWCLISRPFLISVWIFLGRQEHN